MSGGVATFHPSMRSPDELIAAADHALYQAKREGRNCVRLFGHAPLDRISHLVHESQEDRLLGCEVVVKRSL